MSKILLHLLPLLFLPGLIVPAIGEEYAEKVLPVLTKYCTGCHSTEKQKGDLDMERLGTLAEARRHPGVWQGLIDQISLGEMPPKEEPQPTDAEKTMLMVWARRTLEEVALTRAGDPGPVVLRRLNNAEYNYTVQDLTGVESLVPTREFPADSASGEGFMNVGNSLVISPATLTKYLDAARDVAAHAVLLPDGIAFSPSTSQRDWTEERLAAIRKFYADFTVNGGGTAVNLQGIQFDTKDGGILPLERYFAALLEHRDGLKAGAVSLENVAQKTGLNARYLGTLYGSLTDAAPSPLLDPLRAMWRAAAPAQAGELAAYVARWQAALWRFTTVGHIGKRDGPTAWQVPVSPLAETREVRLPLPAPDAAGVVRVYLQTSDAGDGAEQDAAVWKNPRLVAPGRPDIRLRDLRATMAAVAVRRKQLAETAAECLSAAAEVTAPLRREDVAPLAARHGVEPALLAAWLEALGIGAGEARIDNLLTTTMQSAQGYDFIRGWTGADALSVVANSSDQLVKIPGDARPHGVVLHPSPSRRVLVSWRSPVAGSLRISGAIQHAHTTCGNGVAWSLEVRRGSSRQSLAAGIAVDGAVIPYGPLENISVQSGDVVSVVISPRNGDHSCDLTAVDLTIVSGGTTWDLGREISPDILAGNPHADAHGNRDVWHFSSEADSGSDPGPVLPAGSLLAAWQATQAPEERLRLGNAVEALLRSAAAGLPADAPDAVLYQQLLALHGPLLSPVLREPASAGGAISEAPWGLDAAAFDAASGDLPVTAPSLAEVQIPAELAAGCEFVATAALRPEATGTVQMQALAARPSGAGGLAAGELQAGPGRKQWSDGDSPAVSSSPVLARPGTPGAARMEQAFAAFRDLFPAALCYTRIVPVDEVVTLTLHYREDTQLQRLMLDDAQRAHLDRLWEELHFVSQDALKLVDAFEQLWQFATQDADPSAFTPMREPIKKRAEEFQRRLEESRPAQLAAVLRFADKSWRRPLSPAARQSLEELYSRLLAEGLPHEQAVRLVLARVLVAPGFLFRAEQPGPAEAQVPVDAWALATRLSYFLWSSTPDAELLAAAADGSLVRPEILTAQARRMIADPRIRRLSTEFACAWLHIYEFDTLGEKSERHFPTFQDLRSPMYEETIRFFTDLFQRDGSVLDILGADHSFLNGPLAAHYGIPGVEGPGWRRVDGLRALGRGGILGQATFLTKQSGASRTSPILRGNWVAEVLLGDRLPRPPKNVPQLPEDEATATLTMRQLTEKHSSDPRCYGCHQRIDPYGYSLEGFDAIGRLRSTDAGGRPLDTRTTILDGSRVEGMSGLRDYLLTKRQDAFVQQFSRKLLGYALGRSVQLSDQPLLTEMTAQLKSGDFRIGLLFEKIITSRQFREIRGKDTPFD